MTNYHSNVTLTINNIAGLVWENVDSSTIAGTSSPLSAGDKIHNMTKNPTIYCKVEEEGDDENKVKMTLTVSTAGFVSSDLDMSKVYNSVGAGGSWSIGTEVSVDEPATGSVDANKITAISHAMCRTYTPDDASSTLSYENVQTVFTSASRSAFATSIVNKTLTGIDGILDNGDIEIYAKFETDITDPHFDYYTDAGCETKISVGGTDAQKFMLRMLQLHNDNHNLELAAKLSKEVNTQDQDDFAVFTGHSMVIPVDVNVTEGFVNNPGKFGVRITFA